MRSPALCPPSRPPPSGASPSATTPARRNASSRGSQRGQSLVEFALVLPIFLVLALSIIDFGWALRAYLTATNSAREGARLGVTGATADQIRLKTVNSSGDLLTSGNVTVTGAGGQPGTSVTVSVTYPYNYITPLGSLLAAIGGSALPDPLPINTSTTMRLE